MAGILIVFSYNIDLGANKTSQNVNYLRCNVFSLYKISLYNNTDDLLFANLNILCKFAVIKY